MGMESVVYGFIQGPSWPHEVPNKYDAFSKHPEKQLMYIEIDRKLTEKVHQNLQAISALPEEDTWPFLSRSMFSSSTNSIQTTYKSQIIHFGASFKQIEWAWEEWLTKFEALLRKMYWDEVHLHLLSEAWNASSVHYVWKDEDEEKAIYPDHADPVARWTFSGGPRTFRE
jgi:hypothetical protein